MDEKTLARFEAKYVPEPNTGCWLWITAVDKDGYGVFGIRHGVNRRAHRVSYEHHVGIIPEKLVIDHLCRTRCCVNPAHMEPVPAVVNTARRISAAGDRHGLRLHPERAARGEKNGAVLHPERLARGDKNGSRLYPERLSRGSNNGNSKLDENKVREIRNLYAAGGITQTALGIKFSISVSVINNIVHNNIWRHV